MLLQHLVRSDLLGEALFNAVTSSPALRYSLKQRGYLDDSLVTDELVEYHYSISHQEGARHAVGALISGGLNSDVREEVGKPKKSHPSRLGLPEHKPSRAKWF